MNNIDKNKKNQNSSNNDFGFYIDSNIYEKDNRLEIRGDFDNSFSNLNMEDILDVMGCKTRRDIINLLKEEPKFVSEISTELNIGQKAIIEHLRAMEAIGILNSSYKKIVRGRPRKYYDMPHEVNINISITKNSFSIDITEGLLDKLQLPSGDEWSKLLDIEKRIDNGQSEAIEELKNQVRLYDNLKERAEYILERTYKNK
ncbi:MAG: ArsR family transcriptional regulator [Methanobacteriaceae archaeon]|jgi:ArsR family transcriptional regulator|nr:ArsR family transcriptional regulator [Methanobacteriaceae archaeon]